MPLWEIWPAPLCLAPRSRVLKSGSDSRLLRAWLRAAVRGFAMFPSAEADDVASPPGGLKGIRSGPAGTRAQRKPSLRATTSAPETGREHPADRHPPRRSTHLIRISE
ncbi:hypothetical protein MATL_G00000480 [Megalops atlanticus]|uniref:Uncharacterized protein n=1 Tax=Megalops atlanticus TaxID=7932 RepID=A0A9D3QEC3_MEGAT|nr:hypothetical protein MATL_G00000480 [Megalops atlanticus]